MAQYHWPGNVRELENTMHRAVLMASGAEIGAEAILLSTSLVPPASTPEIQEEDDMTDEARRNEQVGRTVASVEKELILDTLDYCLGNRTHAANILGISIRTLRNKLKQYGDEGTDIPAAPGTGTQ